MLAVKEFVSIREQHCESDIDEHGYCWWGGQSPLVNDMGMLEIPQPPLNRILSGVWC